MKKFFQLLTFFFVFSLFQVCLYAGKGELEETENGDEEEFNTNNTKKLTDRQFLVMFASQTIKFQKESSNQLGQILAKLALLESRVANLQLSHDLIVSSLKTVGDSNNIIQNQNVELYTLLTEKQKPIKHKHRSSVTFKLPSSNSKQTVSRSRSLSELPKPRLKGSLGNNSNDNYIKSEKDKEHNKSKDKKK